MILTILSWGITLITILILLSWRKEIKTLKSRVCLLNMDVKYHRLRVELAFKRNAKASKELVQLRSFKRRFVMLIESADKRKNNNEK